MVNERKQLDRLLDRYDDLACQVIEDDKSNAARGLSYCNGEMTQIILETLDWDGFDLFQNMDFESVVKSDDTYYVRAYAFLAYMRLDLFVAANLEGIGDPDFNTIAIASSEYWFKKLIDRYNSLQKKEPQTNHKWIN